MSGEVDRFQGRHFFLSNFYAHPVTILGITYPTNEHAFQAMKSESRDERFRVATASTPRAAKAAGRKISLRRGWDDGIRDDVMRQVVRAKFTDRLLRARLLATGDAPLIEGNTWGDRYWGMVKRKGEWVGENMLGKILMEERARG